jgi:hypothetical protein
MNTNSITHTVKSIVCHDLEYRIPEHLVNVAYKCLSMHQSILFTAMCNQASYWKLYEANLQVDQ